MRGRVRAVAGKGLVVRRTGGRGAVAADRARPHRASDRDRPSHAAAGVSPHRRRARGARSPGPDRGRIRRRARRAAARDRDGVADRRSARSRGVAARRGPRRPRGVRTDAVGSAAGLPAPGRSRARPAAAARRGAGPLRVLDWRRSRRQSERDAGDHAEGRMDGAMGRRRSVPARDRLTADRALGRDRVRGIA